MQIKLAYGKQGLDVTFPDHWNVTVIEPRFVPGLPDPAAALAAALNSPNGAPPLHELVRPTDRVGIVFSDITRATPHGLILPAVLDQLRHVPSDQIILCCALGTHRPNTEAELHTMFSMAGSPALADHLLATYRLVQNDAFDPDTQVHLGVTARGRVHESDSRLQRRAVGLSAAGLFAGLCPGHRQGGEIHFARDQHLGSHPV